ncbi:MAG: tol-pal system protein YbgF [Acidobacteriota bacterium]
MRRLLIPALALFASGCVSSGDIELLHREITDVSRQVEELGRQSSGKADVQAMSQKLAEQSAQVLKSNADIEVEIRQLRDKIDALQSNLDSTSQRLAALSDQLASTQARTGEQPSLPPATSAQGAPATATPPATPPGPGGTVPQAGAPEPAQLYTAAYEDYLRGNYDLAIQGFREYVKRFPTTELADNALYWIGESYYSKRQFQEAIAAFTELLNAYKTSDKAAAALLKKGLAYLEMNDKSQAVINLQYVIYEHPGTKEAELARNRLASLGVKVK